MHKWSRPLAGRPGRCLCSPTPTHPPLLWQRRSTGTVSRVDSRRHRVPIRDRHSGVCRNALVNESVAASVSIGCSLKSISPSVRTLLVESQSQSTQSCGCNHKSVERRRCHKPWQWLCQQQSCCRRSLYQLPSMSTVSFSHYFYRPAPFPGRMS